MTKKLMGIMEGIENAAKDGPCVTCGKMVDQYSQSWKGNSKSLKVTGPYCYAHRQVNNPDEIGFCLPGVRT